MFRLQTSSHATDTITFLMILVCLACSSGCGESERAMNPNGGSSEPPSTESRIAQAESEADAQSTESEAASVEPMLSNPMKVTGTAGLTESPPATETPASSESGKPEEMGDGGPSLDELLARLEVPPPWLDSVKTSYDMSQPWEEARLEIRRLLSFGKPQTHREAIKLTWIYLQQDDIGDGHEYPMYTYLGGEPIWSIRAHEEFIKKPHEHTPIHSYLTLASLYTQYGEFEKAMASLDEAMSGLPDPPWRIMRRADLLAAYGDLYAAWGKIDEAKDSYAKAAALYPTAKPPYGGHLLPRRAAGVQSKLDLLTFRSLAMAVLRDGQYRVKALGYASDIQVTVSIRSGRIADIQIKHEEKIDQNACVIIPQRIIEQQSLQVDGITGATVTKDAIVDGVYRALRQAGLE
jgi:uncharacterized protein with FMN-binding domain